MTMALLTLISDCSPCAPLVAGHVRDSATCFGVEGVLVELYEGDVRVDTATTDSLGRYDTSIPLRSSLLDDCEPAVRVVCTKEGYDTARVDGTAPDVGLSVLIAQR